MGTVNDTESLTQINDILRDYIIPGVQNNILYNSILLDKIKRTTKGVKGRQILIKYRLSGNVAGGFANERGTLPLAKARAFAEGSQSTRYFYQPVDISGQELREVTGKGAHINVVADAFTDSAKSATQIFTNALWGDGSGSLGTVNGASTYDGSTGNSTITVTGSVHRFMIGQELKFDADTTAYEVVEIDYDNSQVLVSGDSTVDAAGGETIYNRDDYTASYNRVVWGLGIHVANSNGVHSSYQGISRATEGNAYLDAYVNSISGVLTSDAMTAHFMRIDDYSQKVPDTILTTNGCMRSIMLLLQADNQPIKTMPNKLGTKQYYLWNYGGKQTQIEVARGCPAGYIYTIYTPSYELRESAPLAWDTTTGGRWNIATTTDSYWGRMYWYNNLVCLNNRASGVMTGVTEGAI
jgi:hypothetical protein